MSRALAAYRADGADAARRGYPLSANPYRTATVDVAGRSHPRPHGYDAKGDAWARGWAKGAVQRLTFYPYHGTRAHLLALAGALRLKGDRIDARLILEDLRDERARHPHRFGA